MKEELEKAAEVIRGAIISQSIEDKNKALLMAFEILSILKQSKT